MGKRSHKRLISLFEEVVGILMEIRSDGRLAMEGARTLGNRPELVLCGINLRLFASRPEEGTAPSGFTEWLRPGEQRSYTCNPHQQLKGFEIAAWGGVRIHDVKVGQKSLTFQVADGFTNVRYDDCTVDVGSQIQIIYSLAAKP
jgi:hypothetical protein